MMYPKTGLPGPLVNLTSIQRLILMLSVIAFSCSKGTTDPDYSSIPDPQSRWQAYNFESYTIEQIRSCFCAKAGSVFQVVVKGDVIVDVIDPATKTSLPTAERQWFKTVDELFNIVHNVDTATVAAFHVEYDLRYGYPKNLYVDPSSQIADEEFGYDNSNLTH